MNAAWSRPDWPATVQSGRKQAQSRVCTPGFKTAGDSRFSQRIGWNVSRPWRNTVAMKSMLSANRRDFVPPSDCNSVNAVINAQS